MRHLLEIAKTGLAAIRLHPLRASATVGAVVVVLVPYLAGLGLSYGIQAEAEDSIRFGADLYVTGEIRHHDALKAAKAGLTVVCTLHSNSERAVLKRLRDRLSDVA